MPSGRVCDRLDVSAEERQKLESWVRRPKTAQRLAWRARIVLRCAEGKKNQDVAHQLGLDVHTVGKWRERFRRKGLEGLADEPRPGAPRRISDEQVERAITRTLEHSRRRARIGARAAWPGRWACHKPQCRGSGERLLSSPIAPNHLSYRRIPFL